MNPGSRVLLTGSTGFIGGELLKRLLARGHDVIAVVRGRDPAARVRERLSLGPAFEVAGRLRVVSGDVALPGFGWNSAERAEIGAVSDVVHAAGLTDFEASRRDEILRQNHVTSLQAARIARDLPAARFLLVSTAFLGGRSGRTVPEAPLPVHDDPLNPYEEAKIRAEVDTARVLEGTSCRRLVVRPSIVVNDRRTGFALKGEHLYALWHPLRRLSRPGRSVRLDFAINALPGGTKDMVPVDTVADALLGLIENPAADGVVNVVAASRMSHEELLRSTERLLGIEGIRLGRAAGAESVGSLEARLDAALRAYGDYLRTPEPPFERGRLGELVPGLEVPRLDDAFLARAFAGFEELRRRPAEAAPVEDAADLARAYVEGHLVPRCGRRLIPGIGNLDAHFTVVVLGRPIGRLAIRIEDGALAAAEVVGEPRGSVTFRVPSVTFGRIVAGKTSPVEEFLAGRVDIEGRVEEGLRLAGLLSEFFVIHPWLEDEAERR